MRIIPPQMQANLDAGATTLCWCWRIIRKDGTVLGYTEHDEDLTFDGMVWQTTNALQPGVLESALGFGSGTGGASGVLTQDGISADDLDAGLYNRANVEIWRVDWNDPDLRVGIWAGEIGDIKRGENGFEAELLGPARKLERSFGRVFTKRCDAELGDGRCRKDISPAPFTQSGSILRVLAANRFALAGVSVAQSNWFEAGLLNWSTGPNAGQSFRIADHYQSGGDEIILLDRSPIHAASVGETFSIIAGCNKSLEHCAGKFTNIINFRGCPFMPGNDSLIASAPKSVGP